MINCIIVDDEPLATALLEKHISMISSLQLAGKATNAMEAYQLLQTQPVDLMFLDIEMPHLNGIDFLKSLSHRPKTIFTTAYREFALEGFELEAVDYLLKPVTFERFFRSVERILRDKKNSEEAFIILKTEGMNRKISTGEIICFESQGNDVKTLLANHEVFISKNRMADLEAALSAKGFIRIHRSFMINSQYITAFSNHEVILGTYTVPVGRSYKNEFDTFIAQLSEKRLL